MKYIFVIQGEGRGHLTQALALSSLLRSEGHSVVEVLIGRCKNREIPKFFSDKIDAPITLFNSPTFEYGRRGKQGSPLRTVVRNLTPLKLNRWIKSLNIISDRLDKSDADVIINFYDLLLGYTKILKGIRQPIVAIGHQFLIDHPLFRSPLKGEAAMLRLNNAICSYGAAKRLALSFYPLENPYRSDLEVVPPLLREEIFAQRPTSEDFTLGYMLNPGYLNDILKWKSHHPEAKVHLFWDKADAVECEERVEGLWLHKINDVEFLKLMSKCRGYITTAGFESICEALYLGKPVVMIPAHIEQQINAADAELVGAGITANEFNLSLLEQAIDNYSANTEEFRAWVDSARGRFLATLTQFKESSNFSQNYF